MKILFAYRTEEERMYIAEKLAEHEIIFIKGALHESEWDGAGIECVSIFVTSHISREELDRLPNLKLITTRSTGYDHIDLPLARERGITVATVPTYGEHTVSEFAFALLLMLSRNLFPARERVIKEGSFSSEGLTGFDLFGKTLGVLGTGRIGKNTIRIARSFAMNILAFDAHPDSAFAQEMNFSYTSLDEILTKSDIISLHLPELSETQHIINHDAIAKMKKGMVIVNTARGMLIDTKALVWGLQENIISAVGLDVLSEEGYVADELRLIDKAHPNEKSLRTLLFNHYLIDHPRVIITPHMAFNTKEALERILDTTIQNIKSFMKGKPINCV